MFQRVVGVRVGGDDALHSGGFDGIRVVVAQGHEQRLFAEAPDFMAAVFFRRAQDSEILSDVIENLRRGPPNRLHPVIVGSDAVDEIQSVGAVAARPTSLDIAGLLELFGVGPVGPSSSPSCRRDCRGSPAPSAAFAETAAHSRRRPCRAAGRRSCRCTRPAAGILLRKRRRWCRTRFRLRNK